MTDEQREWTRAREGLTAAVMGLGFPAELGDEIAKNLGSPKAMNRMISYLHYAKPQKVELVVDEMLAIQSEISAWHRKKAGQKANARYNEFLNYGPGGEKD